MITFALIKSGYLKIEYQNQIIFTNVEKDGSIQSWYPKPFSYAIHTKVDTQLQHTACW